MKAMVLAAGKGERFRSICENIPKPMIKVAGKPVLEHVIDHLRNFGIRDIIINLHYLPNIIRGYFGNGEMWGVSIRYSFEPQLLGTAGAVRKVADELGERFIVYYGDNLCSCDLNKLQEFHRKKGGLATIVTDRSYDDVAGGVVDFDSDGRLISFSEKPPSCKEDVRWENGGIYIMEREIIDFIQEGKASDFGRDVFPSVLKRGGELFCYKADGYVRGIDTPERLRMVQKEVREGGLGQG